MHEGEYPFIEGELPLIDIFNEPYPNEIFRCDGTHYPYLLNLPDIEVFPKNPAPATLFKMHEGEYPYLDTPELIWFSPPYPEKLFFAKENEYPMLPTISEMHNMGACCYTSKLVDLEIPDTTKDIGEFAFTNSRVREVTLAEDCNYYPNSFPVGCKIKTR